jgi:hypothetical protein
MLVNPVVIVLRRLDGKNSRRSTHHDAHVTVTQQLLTA